MARSKDCHRGKYIAGEITGNMGRSKIGIDGYFARCHDDNVGSPNAKRWAKRMVSRARRRLAIPME